MKTKTNKKVTPKGAIPYRPEVTGFLLKNPDSADKIIFPPDYKPAGTLQVDYTSLMGPVLKLWAHWLKEAMESSRSEEVLYWYSHCPKAVQIRFETIKEGPLARVKQYLSIHHNGLMDDYSRLIKSVENEIIQYQNGIDEDREERGLFLIDEIYPNRVFDSVTQLVNWLASLDILKNPQEYQNERSNMAWSETSVKQKMKIVEFIHKQVQQGCTVNKACQIAIRHFCMKDGYKEKEKIRVYYRRHPLEQ